MKITNLLFALVALLAISACHWPKEYRDIPKAHDIAWDLSKDRKNNELRFHKHVLGSQIEGRGRVLTVKNNRSIHINSIGFSTSDRTAYAICEQVVNQHIIELNKGDRIVFSGTLKKLTSGPTRAHFDNCKITRVK